MSLNPSTTDGDGPVRVKFRDGRVELWDRMWNIDNGLIQLFDIDSQLVGSNQRHKKGDEAIAVPIDHIKRIEYTEYGPE